MYTIVQLCIQHKRDQIHRFPMCITPSMLIERDRKSDMICDKIIYIREPTDRNTPLLQPLEVSLQDPNF